MRTKHRLLLTNDAMSFLTRCDEDLRSKLFTFLNQLACDSWQDWMTEASTTIRRERDGDRVLFTHVIQEDVVAQWERVWTVDILSRLDYPTGVYSQEALLSPSRAFFPHVVLYEFGPLRVSSDHELPFQGTTFESTRSMDDLSELETEFKDQERHDEITYNDELHLLATDRIADLLSGEQRGLPLHMAEEQVDVLQSRGPVLLSGEAGSGKTLVIIHWLVINHIRFCHAHNKSPHQLFVTFSERLRSNARKTFEEMLPLKNKDHRTLFMTYRELLSRLLEAGKRKMPEPSLEMDFGRFMRDYSMRIPRLDPVLVWDEIRSVIKGSAIPPASRFIDFETYQTLSDSRGQCKTPPELRESFYTAAQSYQNFLRTKELWDAIDLAYQCIEIVDEGEAPLDQYDRIACDEVQDLAPVEIELLLRLVKSRLVQNFFFTGDTAQVINPSGFHWNRLKQALGEYDGGCSIQDVQHLQRNYRTSTEIIELVNAILAIRREILADEASKSHQNSMITTGLKPMLIQESPLKALMDTSSNPKNRLILVKNSYEKAKLKEQLKEVADRYSILTVEESKGLEWDGVLLWNFFLPRHKEITRNDWEAMFTPAKRDWLIDQIRGGEANPYSLTYEYNLLHVALTRCRQKLFIYDHHKRMRLKNLHYGEVDCTTHTTSVDLDTFKAHWRTKAASPQDLQEHAKRLRGTAMQDSLAFYKQAAELFEKSAKKSGSSDDWRKAAENYMNAEHFKLAASAFKNANDDANALLALAKHYESQGSWVKAGNVWMDRGKLLGTGIEAADAYSKAKVVYSKAGSPDLEAEAATQCAKAVPPEKRLARAERYVEASICWTKMGDLEKAIRHLETAITYGEEIRQDDTTRTIAGEPITSWLARLYGDLGHRYSKQGDLAMAAANADKAASLFLTSENLLEYELIYTQAIVWYIEAYETQKAQAAQQKLIQYFKKNPDYLGKFRMNWKRFERLYEEADELEAQVSTILEHAMLLWAFYEEAKGNERRGHMREGRALIKERAKSLERAGHPEQAIRLFEELAHFCMLPAVADYLCAGNALRETAALYRIMDKVVHTADALMEAGRFLHRVRERTALKVFNECAQLVIDKYQPSLAGWTIFRDIAIESYWDDAEIMGTWVQQATDQFLKNKNESTKLLRRFRLDRKKRLENYRKLKRKKVEQREARRLGWTLICLALVDKTRKKQWIGEFEDLYDTYADIEGFIDERNRIQSMFPGLFPPER